MTHPIRQVRRAERGTATAEYAVGTIGVCSIALVLHDLATDGFWLEEILERVRQALEWRPALRHPVPNRWFPW